MDALQAGKSRDELAKDDGLRAVILGIALQRPGLPVRFLQQLEQQSFAPQSMTHN